MSPIRVGVEVEVIEYLDRDQQKAKKQHILDDFL